MTVVPQNPQIYHITHVENLASIISCGELWSDAHCLDRGLEHTKVGMTEIKRRRLFELHVDCHPGTKVGDYVPFYFCPRSIMLFLLHMGNHPDLIYKGGQQPIVHLQADLLESVSWADNRGIRWAFSDRNAATRYAAFYKDLNALKNLDWDAVNATDFRDPAVKDGKQAEFLMYLSFPCTLIGKIGVYNESVSDRVQEILGMAAHIPQVSIERKWYF